MLSPASRTASSACLRCQLRQAIFGRETQVARGVAQRCRLLSTSAGLRHGSAGRPVIEEPFVQPSKEIQPKKEIGDHKNDRGYAYRHLNLPGGRVVGQKGRRQRQQSQKLRINTLGKEAGVILMKDVEETPHKPKEPAAKVEKERGEDKKLSATAIEAAIAHDGEAPQQDEVNQSLETLRPSRGFMDKSQFDQLSRDLASSYNVQQLATYLVQSLASSQGPQMEKLKDGSQLKATAWQAGKKPLIHRLKYTILKKKDIRKTKTGVIDQILRNIWGVLVHSEEQEIGQLETRLEPWQMNMLFDMTTDGVANVHKLLDSEFLMRGTEIQPIRKANVVRITARRHDAEELLARLGKGLADIGELEVDVNLLSKARSKGFGLSTKHPGRKFTAVHRNDCKQVSEATGAYIEMPPDSQSLTIYHASEKTRYNARRLLLALADLPHSTNPYEKIPSLLPSDKSLESSQDLVWVPFANPYIHERHRGRDLYRIVSSNNKLNTDPTGDKSTLYQKKVKYGLIKGLAKFKPLATVKHAVYSPWRQHLDPNTWDAQFCLQTTREPDPWTSAADKKTIKPRIAQVHRVPGADSLLSHFEPVQTTNSNSVQLLARFIPSPFSKNGIMNLNNIPPIQATFEYSRAANDSMFGPKQLRLTGISAELKLQTHEVYLPGASTDLHLTRRSKLSISGTDLNKIDFMTGFATRLQESAASAQGYLDGMPEITATLPTWAVQDSPKLTEEARQRPTEVEYLLDHFEQVQQTDFVPPQGRTKLDPVLQEVFKSWPSDLVLRRREVDAGSFGGTRAELALVNIGADASQKTDSKRFIDVVVSIVELITQADAGSLKSFYQSAAYQEWMIAKRREDEAEGFGGEQKQEQEQEQKPEQQEEDQDSLSVRPAEG